MPRSKCLDLPGVAQRAPLMSPNALYDQVAGDAGERCKLCRELASDKDLAAIRQ